MMPLPPEVHAMIGGLRFVDQALDQSAGAGPTWLCRCGRVSVPEFNFCPACGSSQRFGERITEDRQPVIYPAAVPDEPAANDEPPPVKRFEPGIRRGKVLRAREIIRRRGGLEPSKVDAAVDGLGREVQS